MSIRRVTKMLGERVYWAEEEEEEFEEEWEEEDFEEEEWEEEEEF